VPYNITNAGLSIDLPFIQTALSAAFSRSATAPGVGTRRWRRGLPLLPTICIPFEKGRILRRLPFPARPFPLHMVMAGTEKNNYL
jgi:hypothetical protein